MNINQQKAMEKQEISGDILRKEIFDKVVPEYRKHKKAEIELPELEHYQLYEFCKFDLDKGMEYIYNKGLKAGQSLERERIEKKIRNWSGIVNKDKLIEELKKETT